MGHGQGCLLEDFPAGGFQQDWGEAELLVRRAPPGSCGAALDLWAQKGFVALFVVERVQT